MKVSGLVIQNKNIKKNTSTDFEATYKGKQIIITTNHCLGSAKYGHLNRYDIDVIDIKTGMYDVNTYIDLHTMHNAIRFALIGACLLKFTYNK